MEVGVFEWVFLEAPCALSPRPSPSPTCPKETSADPINSPFLLNSPVGAFYALFSLRFLSPIRKNDGIITDVPVSSVSRREKYLGYYQLFAYLEEGICFPREWTHMSCLCKYWRNLGQTTNFSFKTSLEATMKMRKFCSLD